jgi:hypothetical protein
MQLCLLKIGKWAVQICLGVTWYRVWLWLCLVFHMDWAPGGGSGQHISTPWGGFVLGQRVGRVKLQRINLLWHCVYTNNFVDPWDQACTFQTTSANPLIWRIFRQQSVLLVSPNVHKLSPYDLPKWCLVQINRCWVTTVPWRQVITKVTWGLPG